MTAENVVPDQALLDARGQARRALEDITEASSIGAEAGHEVHEARVVTLYFECKLSGYPGWRWAATLTKVDDAAAVNVLEVELLPGENAVVAPDWVPWSERLAHFREMKAQHDAEHGSDDDLDDADEVDESAEALAAAAELSDEDDAEDSVLDNDFSDFGDDLHGADLDADEADVSDADSEADTDEVR